MNQDQTLSFIRSLLKIIGGALIAHGATTAAGWVNTEDAAGLILAIIGFVSSHLTHKVAGPPPNDADAPPANSSGTAAKVGLLLLIPALMLGGGCQSTPNRIAYNTTSVVATSVNTAVQAYWDYKAKFGVSADTDAKVKAAYLKYQGAMKVSSDAYEAYLKSPDGQPAWMTSVQVAAAAEADLLSLINQFTQGK